MLADRHQRTWARWTVLVAWAMALLLVAEPVGAQQDTRLTLVGGLGYEPGGPGPALVDALEAAGMDDVRYGACLQTVCPNGVQHPFYSNAGIDLVAFAGLRYRFRAPFSIEARISNGQRGHAEGYDETAKRHLLVSYVAFVFSGTAALHLGPLRLEAGPALNRTAWTATRNSVNETQGRTWTLGGVAAVGGELRAGDALISFKAGVRQFPGADLLEPVSVPLQVDYDSILIGLTVTRWIG